MTDRIKINRAEDYAAIYVDGQQVGVARLSRDKWVAIWAVQRGSADRLPGPFGTQEEAVRAVVEAARRVDPTIPTTVI